MHNMFNPRDTEVVIYILFVLLKWKIGYSKTAMKELKPYNSIVKIITIVFPMILVHWIFSTNMMW